MGWSRHTLSFLSLRTQKNATWFLWFNNIWIDCKIKNRLFPKYPLPNSLISWENLPMKKKECLNAWLSSRKQKLNKFQIIYSAAHNWSSKLPNHHQKPIGNSFHLKLPAIIFSALRNFFAIYPNQCSNFNSINPNTHRHILGAPASAAAFFPLMLSGMYNVYVYMYVYVYIRKLVVGPQ